MKKTSQNSALYNRQALRDVKKLKRIARKMIDQMESILRDKSRSVDKEESLFAGRYSMISSLNTLTNLVIALQAREQVVAQAREGDVIPAIPVSEEDVRLLEHFIHKNENV